MPGTYAHYKFGKDVYKRVPEAIRLEIRKHLGLYEIGLHGPDILFYYKPLFKNRINGAGSAMHDRPAAEFFGPGVRMVRETGEDHGERAYLYGFLTHFILDSQCHGYVEEKRRASGISHSEIETEFDRMLMVEDGLDPVSRHLTDHIDPSRKNAAVIARFFPGISSAKVEKALRSMKWYSDLLVAPGRGKRLFLKTALKAVGAYEGIGGMIVNYEPNPRCADSCERLKELYEAGLAEAADMLPQFRQILRSGAELPSRYLRTFGAEEGEEKDESAGRNAEKIKKAYDI